MNNHSKNMIMICYVDDLVIFAKNASALDKQKMKINKKLMTKDL